MSPPAESPLPPSPSLEEPPQALSPTRATAAMPIVAFERRKGVDVIIDHLAPITSVADGRRRQAWVDRGDGPGRVRRQDPRYPYCAK
ncbi:hypothetical protein GCM10022199_12380 [Marihabitans asiaticum]